MSRSLNHPYGIGRDKIALTMADNHGSLSVLGIVIEAAKKGERCLIERQYRFAGQSFRLPERRNSSRAQPGHEEREYPGWVGDCLQAD